jgi:hypothetical protein
MGKYSMGIRLFQNTRMQAPESIVRVGLTTSADDPRNFGELWAWTREVELKLVPDEAEEEKEERHGR